MWMGEQQQLKRLDKKRNFSIILKKAKKFFTSLPQTVDKVLRERRCEIFSVNLDLL